MDSSRLALKWQSADRLVELIVATARSRVERATRSGIRLLDRCWRSESVHVRSHLDDALSFELGDRGEMARALSGTGLRMRRVRGIVSGTSGTTTNLSKSALLGLVFDVQPHP